MMAHFFLQADFGSFYLSIDRARAWTGSASHAHVREQGGYGAEGANTYRCWLLQCPSAGRTTCLYACAHGRRTRLGWSGMGGQSGLRLTRPLRMMMLRAVAWSSEAMRHLDGLGYR
jgi:hypothetical protein